jgi:hypothetical protein
MQKSGGKNMKKSTMRLMILSLILLVSTSGIVLGVNNSTANDTGRQTIAHTNVTGASTATNTAYPVTTVTEIKKMPVSTPEKVIVTDTPISPKDTSVPQKPVTTPKSPGLGPVVSIVVILSAMYISKRK